MRKKVVLLIFSAEADGEAVWGKLKREWDRRGADCTVINLITCLPERLGSCLPKLYKMMIQHAPALWRKLYHRSNRPYTPLSPLLSPLCKEACKTLDRIQPDMLVTTHPLAAAVAGGWVGRCRTNERPALFSVVNDYSMHGMSLSKEVNGVFLPDDEEIRSGQDSYPFSRFARGCISIRGTWSEPVDKEALRRQIGLPLHAKAAAVSGGREGLLPFRKIIRAFDRDAAGGWTLLCFTGENRRDARRLIKADSSHDVRVFPFTPAYEDYVKAADLLITRPDSVTVTGALHAQIPILVTAPLPGQEEQNILRLKKHPLVHECTPGMMGIAAEKVLSEADSPRENSFVTAGEMIDEMIAISEEQDEKNQFRAPERARVLRMNHILAMRAKQDEEREFRS
ncbi:MGDG synthase family glycosyltransferase [Alteribacter natronophilus]|uniref:MGDG synthase family glycosyltransferase n=1 Tax=Alteribacter natronophilus TaxID=2583810 RepID=UPI001486EA0C|nr:hypothetical protein [Alteribacter natronophilus]